MLVKKGFTLIEVLFTISILIILSTFTLTYSITTKPQISLNKQCQLIISLLEEGKSVAILNHRQVDIEISANMISFNNDGKEKKVTLTGDNYIDHSYDFHFNRNGNISSGGKLNICNQKQCKSIILNVGSGAFYVK